MQIIARPTALDLHASRSADRFEALEPIRQGMRERFGAFGNNAAAVSPFATITAPNT